MRIDATKEAKTHLSAQMQEVTHGETIVIARGRKPLAKLVPYAEPAPRPKVGEVMDAPFSVAEDALRPMNRKELKSWGL